MALFRACLLDRAHEILQSRFWKASREEDMQSFRSNFGSMMLLVVL